MCLSLTEYLFCGTKCHHKINDTPWHCYIVCPKPRPFSFLATRRGLGEQLDIKITDEEVRRYHLYTRIAKSCLSFWCLSQKRNIVSVCIPQKVTFHMILRSCPRLYVFFILFKLLFLELITVPIKHVYFLIHVLHRNEYSVLQGFTVTGLVIRFCTVIERHFIC